MRLIQPLQNAEILVWELAYAYFSSVLCGDFWFFFFLSEPTHACISWVLPNKNAIQNDRNLVSGTEIHLCALMGFWPCIIKSIYLLFVLFKIEYKADILWLCISTVVLSKSISRIAHLKHFSFEVSSILKSTFNQQIFCIFGFFHT